MKKENSRSKKINNGKNKSEEQGFVWTATVGEKGQIVIPKQARELFGIYPGDNLLLFGDRNRGMVIPPRSRIAGLWDSLYGEDTEQQ